jgi:hypothetical protein
VPEGGGAGWGWGLRELLQGATVAGCSGSQTGGIHHGTGVGSGLEAESQTRGGLAG